MAIDYGNFPSLDPANIGYTSCPAYYTPLAQVLSNVVRVFLNKQAGAITEISNKWGVTLTAISSGNCKVGVNPTPVVPSFFVRGTHSSTNAGQLLELVYSIRCWVVIPEAETEAERTSDASWYADLMERIFWQANPQLYLWRAQFVGESDGDYMNFLTSIPPVSVRAEALDITGQNSPFERCATAQGTLEIRSTTTIRR